MAKGQKWETKPLDSWNKAKELRANWQKSIESKEKVVGQGNNTWFLAFPAITVIEDNPAGSMIAAKSDSFARKSRLACEVRGWGREICGYNNTCWGGQFLGFQDDGSPFPYRQFVVPIPCVCDSHTKRGEQVKDFSPVMRWQLDFNMYLGDRDEDRELQMHEHKTYCTLKQVNDMERIFGQHFNDEEMIRIIRSRSVVGKAREDVSNFMRHVPAPLTAKDMYSFFTMGMLTKMDPDETAAFWKMFRDEVEWRVQNNIAAVGNEQFRWMEAHPPPWHYLKYYRYMEQKYGAVCIGSQYVTGSSIIMPDGNIGRVQYATLPDDIPLESREDIFRYWSGIEARGPHTWKMDEYLRPYALNEFAETYNIDGALLGLWRSGVGCNLTRKEQAMKLREAGYSVMLYEGSQPGDRNDMDEMRFLDQLDNWLESQNLKKVNV
jgi:benzoyl-CoA reductase/2-hydroxyglutaryl-CoA dehydratase subunit BcrC/BadD/HgdB